MREDKIIWEKILTWLEAYRVCRELQRKIDKQVDEVIDEVIKKHHPNVKEDDECYIELIDKHEKEIEAQPKYKELSKISQNLRREESRIFQKIKDLLVEYDQSFKNYDQFKIFQFCEKAMETVTLFKNA